MLRGGHLRNAASRSLYVFPKIPVQPTPLHRSVLHARALTASSKSGESFSIDAAAKRKQGFLQRIFSPGSSGQNRILKAMGYYSAESRAIHAGNSLYRQAVQRAEAAALAESNGKPNFSTRFEMLSVHIYLTLRRMREERGGIYEGDVKTAMQCLFDVFWTDLRSRMIKDHEMSLITSGKWIKECEQMFFGLAMSFDDGWENEEIMRDSIRRNLTCLQEDDAKIEKFRKYIMKERARLGETTVEQMWDGTCWDDDYPARESS